MPNEKDTILDGFEKSVANMLNDTHKNAISNGFNSIVDLTDNDSNDDSQRNLFTDNQWAELNRLFNKQKQWTSIHNDIQKKLKIIEKLAKTDLKAAYLACLNSQITCAMTSDEVKFEIYAFLLKILHEKTSILNSASKEKFTEGDYVIML
ncbi:hypothetical protein RMATCC62417_12598 [Rhizopus microsporus]|nr:hypothetical protein RMATCC62417_09733 [Rhizopus microsporus]CEG77926.1 hypothetical protein RMATCC62417_12598 [Rhizopus microsporus]